MSATAFTHADLVRRVARKDVDPIPSMAALAEELARDPSNLNKTVKALVQDGVFTRAPGSVPTLTGHGAVVLQGIDVAEGRATAGVGSGGPEGPTTAGQTNVWPADLIKPNPLNRAIKADKVDRRADSIAEHGIIQPLALSPVDANGVRMLVDGEYRWRGHLLTIEQGRPHPSLADGLPFVEREVSEDEALAITIVANIEREGLTPWEEAQQIAKLADAAQGVSGAELARRLNKGAKDVQDKIRLVREASPEQIAAYEEHGSWDQFRNAVFGRAPAATETVNPAEPGNLPLQLFIVEAALRSDNETGVWDGDLALDTQLEFPISWSDDWFSYGRLSGHFRLTSKATDWLARIGFGDDAAEVYARITKLAGYSPPTPGHWRSQSLRVASAPTGPYVVNGVDFHNAARANEARRSVGLLPPLPANYGGSASASAAESAQPAPELPGVETGAPAPLSARAVLALVELAHKIKVDPRVTKPGGEPADPACELAPDDHAVFGAYVGKYWTDAAFNELATARLIRAVSLPGGVPPMATLTQAGVDWFSGHDDFALPVTRTILEKHQMFEGHFVDTWATPWLATEVAPAATPHAPEADDQPALIEDTDHWGRDAEAIAADQRRLDRVIAFNAFRDDIDEELGRQWLADLGVTGPFSEDGDAGLVAEIDGATASFAFVDPDRALPPERARAIAILAAWALQVVFGEAA